MGIEVRGKNSLSSHCQCTIVYNLLAVQICLLLILTENREEESLNVNIDVEHHHQQHMAATASKKSSQAVTQRSPERNDFERLVSQDVDSNAAADETYIPFVACKL